MKSQIHELISLFNKGVSKSTITTVTCIALMSATAFAQDIITYKNGTEAKVKVSEVTGNEVKFKNLLAWY